MIRKKWEVACSSGQQPKMKHVVSYHGRWMWIWVLENERPRTQLSSIRVSGIAIVQLTGSIIMLQFCLTSNNTVRFCINFIAVNKLVLLCQGPGHKYHRRTQRRTLLPLAKGLLCLMEISIQGFWRDTKSTKDFDRKVTKICMAPKQSSNYHQ